MKRKLLALCLVLCLMPVLSAQAEDGFIRQRTYAGEFSDLTPDSRFYDNVAALYEYGLASGKADGTFGLEDPVTLGQAIIFAGRIRGLYRTGDAETALACRQETEPIALAYLRYLQEEGVLELELEDYGSLYQPAARAQVAHVLANILPEKVLPRVHDELVTQAYASRRFITDVNEYTPYYQDILELYRRGVSMGSTGTGAFRPSEPVTRGAAAAMLTRMVEPALRVQPQWDLSALYSAQGLTLSDLVEPGKPVLSPTTREELDEAVRYMLSRNSSQLVLYYPGIDDSRARRLMDQVLSVIKTYCEQGYNTVYCTHTAGIVTLSFSAAGAGKRTEEFRAAAMEAAIAVHDRLWEEGILRPGMTELEKARVYYDWICANFVYDYQAGAESSSHVPYSLFANGSAVCDGYTGAYNLFLKLEGIACTAQANDSHIWTVATLDGVLCHIDATWGDSGSAGSDSYFAMTPQQSWSYHRW